MAGAETPSGKRNVGDRRRRRPWRQATQRNAPLDDNNIVNWKQSNVRDGFVVVDENQLSKLIKREPIEKYYKLEDAPFATGLFASVRRCQSLETGVIFAAKFSSKKRYGEDCSGEIYHEIALLSLCGSAPRIIQIHDVFETKAEIILIMEYAPGGDLQTIIDDNLVPYEDVVVNFIRQCVEGLDFLHKRKIAHLDIKPQNIVMMGNYPNCDIKLCDLEISRVILDGNDVREILGTPDYVAPEILHYEPITLAADIWSLGVTTYVLLTGFSPFGGETDQETFSNISRGDVDFPQELFEGISEDATDFLKSTLIKDPSARLSTAGCLKHPWLSGKTKPVAMVRDDKEDKELIAKSNPVVSKNTLRKYLSKSREALFEKMMQHHLNGNLRKSAVKNHLFSKTRLCESHMSLLSNSREKLGISPSFSRSIEKIYGLRSLSKSQEVLNLYKNGCLLASQENINMISEVLKSRENLTDGDFRDRKLTRATTADLGVLRHRNRTTRMYSGSSTTSIASIAQEEVQEEEEEETKLMEDRRQSLKSSIEREKEETKELPSEKGCEEENADEPHFTVAQLITAYNKHQEIVTKTSLEVTMTAPNKESKILPVSPAKAFPTGPTALRLFIPDIDLVELPKKARPKYSIRFFDEKSDGSEPNSGEWNSEEAEMHKEGKKDDKYIRSSSLSSETSTVISTEGSTSTASWEELSLNTVLKEINEIESTQLTVSKIINRSKSASPSPVTEKIPTRKLSAGSCMNATTTTAEQKKTEKNDKISRKSSLRDKSPQNKSKSPLPARKTSTGSNNGPGVSTNYKIVGLPDRNKKSQGISYKIEFDGPKVTRKFPNRNGGDVSTKTTISSQLKKQDSVPLKSKKK